MQRFRIESEPDTRNTLNNIVMNELIDLGFLAAKVAAIGNEKAKMTVDGASLGYNLVQVGRFKSMMSELYKIANYVVFNAEIRGYCTKQEYDLVMECYRQISDCQNQISKHGVMSIVDGLSLLVGAITSSNRQDSQRNASQW